VSAMGKTSLQNRAETVSGKKIVVEGDTHPSFISYHIAARVSIPLIGEVAGIPYCLCRLSQDVVRASGCPS
jgi:hypothetical protein